MSRRFVRLFALLASFAVSPALVWAQEAETPMPATHTVTQGPLTITADLSGVFESGRMTELAVRPDEWSKLVVVEAVEQGSLVKQGDVLLRLETGDLDDAIADAERATRLSAIALRQAEAALSLLEQTTPIDLAQAERAKAMADEDLAHLLEVSGPLSERAAHTQLKRSREQLEYAEEELNQLEKMYKADDLTEETEEIIIKRAQRDVEAARFRLEQASVDTEHTLSVDLPRQREQATQAARRQTFKLDEARSELPAALEKKRLEVEQARIAQARGDERLAKLRADRNLLTVTAPHDGIVFYGAPNRGKWSGAASVAPQLRPFATLTANATVITVVEPRPLFVRVDLPEKDLHLVRAGITGQALPTAFLDLKIPAKVTSVSAVPVSGGSFDLQIAVELAESAAAVMPGMTCQVKLTSYSSEAALTVPAASVFTDEADGRRFVYFVPADGTHEKRYVKVGRSNDAVIEIVEGLKAGERILQSEPAAK